MRCLFSQNVYGLRKIPDLAASPTQCAALVVLRWWCGLRLDPFHSRASVAVTTLCDARASDASRVRVAQLTRSALWRKSVIVYVDHVDAWLRTGDTE
jgi:hypothetical protein